MHHKHTCKMLKRGASFALCCALILGLTACGGEKKANTQETSSPAAATQTQGTGNGVPSKEAPAIKSEGVLHQNETLYFMSMGEFDKKEDAQAAFDKLSKSLADGGQKNFWFVAETNWFKDGAEAPVLEESKSLVQKGLPQKKFVLAHAYPSAEALEGYRAADYASSFEIKPVHSFSATFTSDQPIVVLGVDAQ